MRTLLCGISVFLTSCTPALADWPTVRGDAARTGRVETEMRPSYRLAWARYFVGERLGSNFEPIVADGKVFLGTHQGNLYALEAASGKAVWRYATHGPVLHSPAYAEGLVVTGDAAGYLHAVEAGSGKPRWSVFASPGGFSASPTVAEGAVMIGSRTGEFLAVELADGKIRWRVNMPAPIRQTAAFHDGRVYVTADDLRVRCLDVRTKKEVWTSEPLWGQTARDGFPVVVRPGQRTYVVVRTNPVVNMAQRIAQDRRLLCQSAGVDDSDWRKLDAWTKSDQALGTPELWQKEQAAIVRYLQEHPEAGTLFVLDAQTGQETGIAPVLWCSGCQGIGAPPAVMPDGRLLVFYRSAYGNWNHGVAPLVALGLLDLADNRITPLQHTSGKQPPWNTFWGTADESQTFESVGNSVLIIHQSTLSRFDIANRKLSAVWGERDSWGGFRNLPWPRNEWNGPARGGVAVDGEQLYWQTGSRILCLAPGQKLPGAKDEATDLSKVPAVRIGIEGDSPVFAERKLGQSPEDLSQRLAAAVEEVLSRRWAPLYVEPGLAGREFFFDQSGDLFAALAQAYPHLSTPLQERVKKLLDDEWRAHPPFAAEAQYPLDQGERREWYRVPQGILTRLGHNQPLRFGNTYAIWLWAERCDRWERIREAWPQLKAGFEDFSRTRWKLDANKGDLFANRYLAASIAFAHIARKLGDDELAQRAERQADETTAALLTWWQGTAERASLPVIPSVKEWDEFINRGDPLFFRVVPHRSKLALIHDLSPEVAARVKAKAPAAVEKVWRTITALCPTWHLMGEERQVHYGENSLDPPDLAMDCFASLALLSGAPAADLAPRVDVPFCHADLYYIAKLAIVLDRK